MPSPGPGYNYVALRELRINNIIAFEPGQWVPDSTIATQGWSVGSDISAPGTVVPTGQMLTSLNYGSYLDTKYGSNGQTVALLGDSITANNGVLNGTQDPGVATTLQRYHNALGWFTWANIRLGHRLIVARQAGIAGERSDQILTRVDTQILTMNPLPAWCTVMAGTNDINQMATLPMTSAQSIANLTAIYTKLRGAGIKIIACTVLGSTNFTGAQLQMLADINAFIRNYASTNPGVVLVDWDAYWADPTTGNPVAGYAVDGVTHPGPVGASRLGKVMADALSPFVLGSRAMASSNANPNNLSSNPNMLGAVTTGFPAGVSGTAATGLAFSWSGTAGVAAVSKVSPRSDLVQGEWQQIQMTTGGHLIVRLPDATTGFAAGDRVYAELEFETDPGWTAPTWFFLTMSAFASPTSGFTADAYNASINGDANFVAPPSGVLRTPPITVPSVSSNILRAGFEFQAIGTVRIGRFRIMKAPAGW
jgi:lysophospholipase L1-like esterase